MNQRQWSQRVAACLCLLVLVGCAQVPLTNRRQLILVNRQQELAMGEEAYAEVLKEAKISGNAAMTAVMKRVGRRIADTANEPSFTWEFNLIESDQVNAWCLPGGKVAVYTGILPVCKNEGGLAAVIGHEVAHALARHGAERMSHGQVVNILGKGIDAALQSKAPGAREGVLAAYGLGANVGVMLPYSRSHESEADRIGIELMAKTGYDPSEAAALWDRMAEAGGKAGFEFLSTHPHSDKRAVELRKVMPAMKNLYEHAPNQYGIGESLSR